MTVQKTKPVVVWRLSDDRPGHDTQSHGLLKALGDRTTLECLDVQTQTFCQNLLNIITGKYPAGNGLPDPDLLLGAGHATHLSLLCARRARGGKAVVLMKPSFPYWCFDYCIVPDHDAPPPRKNIIATRGVINSVTTSKSHVPARGLILLGGPSRHYSWQTDKLISQLNEIINHDSNIKWTIADSIRTPGDMIEQLTKQAWKDIQILSHLKCDSAGLHELYQKCGTIWVSEDSVSMVYEALTSGARVGILETPRNGHSKIADSIDRLATSNIITLFKEWQMNRKMNNPIQDFNEASRCAEVLQQHLSGS